MRVGNSTGVRSDHGMRCHSAASQWQRVICFDWLPLEIAGLAVWVRADLGVTLNSGNVSAWADQSGNGRNFSQGTAANQPLWTAIGLNGQPIVTFDGTNDLLSTGAFAYAGTKTSAVSYKMVTRVGVPVIYGTAAATNMANFVSGVPKLATTETFTLQISVDVANGVWAQQTTIIQDSTSSFRVNGASVGTGDTGAEKDWLGITLGGLPAPSNWGNFALAEAAFYTGVVPTPQLQHLEAYQRARGGLSAP